MRSDVFSKAKRSEVISRIDLNSRKVCLEGSNAFPSLEAFSGLKPKPCACEHGVGLSI
jgi:G:T-mismatch repair DNA endonuclease (very short patch repair protein)